MLQFKVGYDLPVPSVSKWALCKLMQKRAIVAAEVCCARHVQDWGDKAETSHFISTLYSLQFFEKGRQSMKMLPI